MDDPELQEILEKYEGSLHDLIDELLRGYFVGEDEDMAVVGLAVRRKRLEREREMLKEQKQTIQENINDIDSELEVIEGVTKEMQKDLFIPYLEKCKELGEERRDPSNDAIRLQAEKAGLSPQLFVEKLNECYPLGRFGRPSEEPFPNTEKG